MSLSKKRILVTGGAGFIGSNLCTYLVSEAGFKCNMTDIQAAIGLVELERYESETIPKRRQICEKYIEYFSQYEWAILPKTRTEDATSSYHLFLLRIKGINETTRDRIIDEIYQNQVAVNVHFQPLPLLTFYKNLGYKIETYPSAYANYEKVISLPVYYNLSDDDLNTVMSTVSNAIVKFLG